MTAITLEHVWNGVQQLNVQVGQISTKIGQLDTKVGQLDTKIKQLDKKIDEKIDDLAALVKEGFDDMDQQFQSFKKEYYPEQRVIHARLERLEARVGI